MPRQRREIPLWAGLESLLIKGRGLGTRLPQRATAMGDYNTDSLGTVESDIFLVETGSSVLGKQ